MNIQIDRIQVRHGTKISAYLVQETFRRRCHGVRRHWPAKSLWKSRPLPTQFRQATDV